MKNQRNRMIALNMGFYGDNNFGVDYDKLFEHFHISDFFKYFGTKGFVRVDEYWIKSNLINSCEKLDWDTDFDVRIQVNLLPTQNVVAVCFDIIENLDF